MPSGTTWTAIEFTRALKMLRDGETRQAICVRLGLNRNTVARMIDLAAVAHLGTLEGHRLAERLDELSDLH
jgi:hypothetical protein